MIQDIRQPLPRHYDSIYEATIAMGFTMPSDIMTCSLLRALAASKPSGKFLELGTGTGLATSWILDGMDARSTLTSLDNDSNLLEVARRFLGNDKRLNIVTADGGDWLKTQNGNKFDYIFADTWHGKYLMLDETLELINVGGLYIVDDMIPQPNWPDGHHEKALKLTRYLDGRRDFLLVKQVWATGIIVAVKKQEFQHPS